MLKVGANCIYLLKFIAIRIINQVLWKSKSLVLNLTRSINSQNQFLNVYINFNLLIFCNVNDINISGFGWSSSYDMHIFVFHIHSISQKSGIFENFNSFHQIWSIFSLKLWNFHIILLFWGKYCIYISEDVFLVFINMKAYLTIN